MEPLRPLNLTLSKEVEGFFFPAYFVCIVEIWKIHMSTITKSELSFACYTVWIWRLEYKDINARKFERMSCHQVETSTLFPHLRSSREFSGSVPTNKDWFINVLKNRGDSMVRACVELDDNVLCNKKYINTWFPSVFKNHQAKIHRCRAI